MKIKIVYGRRGATHFFIDGVEVTRKEFDAAAPNRLDDLLKKPEGERDMLPSQTKTCWPMVSEAAGIHPEQIAEATAHNKRMGDNVTYTPDGEAIFTSRGQRAKHLKNIRLLDRQGGYGD